MHIIVLLSKEKNSYIVGLLCVIIHIIGTVNFHYTWRYDLASSDTGLDLNAGLDILTEKAVAFVEKATNPVFIGIRTRGVHLATRIRERLQKRLDIKIPMGTLDITLYRDDITDVLKQPVIHGTDIPFGLEEKNVLIFDDVLYTGRTAHAAMTALGDLGRVRNLCFAVLVDRGLRELPIQADYVGFSYPVSSGKRVLVRLAESDGEDKIMIESK